MLHINGNDVHIGANSVWNTEEWLVQTALGDHTLFVSFKGNGFLELNSESSSLEGLQMIGAILSTLTFQKNR
jgi:hypothetical protein